MNRKQKGNVTILIKSLQNQLAVLKGQIWKQTVKHEKGMRIKDGVQGAHQDPKVLETPDVT